jgi:hypothetical protein|tara:strand:- start:5 stop:469 length:465 start_codon:yes stop_codon:yes gene_type:complete
MPDPAATTVRAREADRLSLTPEEEELIRSMRVRKLQEEGSGMPGASQVGPVSQAQASDMRIGGPQLPSASRAPLMAELTPPGGPVTPYLQAYQSMMAREQKGKLFEARKAYQARMAAEDLSRQGQLRTLESERAPARRAPIRSASYRPDVGEEQ